LKLPDAGHLLLITGGPELLKIIRRKAAIPLLARAWPWEERESTGSGRQHIPAGSADPWWAEHGGKARSGIRTRQKLPWKEVALLCAGRAAVPGCFIVS